ncbi:hypothetical protein BDN70DRAFT_878871 [Pholiota conissans]|uniref:DUF2828 domain-containing protein n=1 Tax=Pholiota conissans TaxID=109636 RepID=A0A9P5Z1G1_9AGAR|nr:hypothetical protein BDN70DRAFT_878871 [Pholiota conissans]
MAAIHTAEFVASTRPVTLPDIPELYNPNYLDVLVPGSTEHLAVEEVKPVELAPVNPYMDALKATANRTYTENQAQALKSTLSPVLDAFNGLTQDIYGSDISRYLTASWKEDPQLTLRLIWNLRSIHDGVGDKELFYRAYGWLYDNHPRTAIANLHHLVTPVCVSGKKNAPAKAHGYWKDLLNIVALACVDELSDIPTQATFLHAPRSPFTYHKNKMPKIAGQETPAERIEASLRESKRAKERAARARKEKAAENHKRLVEKLAQPKFRALYVAVARLFAEQLVKDLAVLQEINALAPGEDRLPLIKKLSLAGKWAPTPSCSHDNVTLMSTAIADLIHAAQVFTFSYPSVLKTSTDPQQRAVVLRSFYQRWVLTELRRAAWYPEPLMSAQRWKEIKYNWVSSAAMKNNMSHFFAHDPEGFEQYLTSVEENKKSISGATLLPHELVAEAIKCSQPYDESKKTLGQLKRKLASTRLRVVEAQWKTLIDNLREAGSIENSLAICDVSGSMGYISGGYDKRHVQPILPAVALSLVLASLSKAPWNGGFVTFSAHPQFVTVDLAQPLADQVRLMQNADWSMNTNLQAVFLDLLLPLAVQNNVKQEDMVKRLFVFTDMQFDEAQPENEGATVWETNYDRIEQAYKAAGYEVPQIVYWDLASSGNAANKTVEVESDRKGVAMMNGFSPAMLKVFMGEQVEEEEAEAMEWESVGEDGESVTVVEKKAESEFNPENVMKKALMRPSYDGLVILD